MLTDWKLFIGHSAPLLLKPLLALSRPLWRARIERSFKLAGGWNLPWMGRPTVGVKPPRLIAVSDRALGERLFIPVSDPDEKTRFVTCHELTHAFTTHLRLPVWLHEGLAMRAVDHLAGRDTLLPQTRDQVAADPSTIDRRAYRRVADRDHDALVRLYATGYWRTRLLDEQHPTVLTRLLSRRRNHRVINASVARLVDGKDGR